MAQMAGDIGVEVGKGFDEARWMAWLEAVVARLLRYRGVAGAAVEQHVATIGPAQPQILRVHLEPFGAGLATEYPDTQPVTVAQGGLAIPGLDSQVVLVAGQAIDVVNDAFELAVSALLPDDLQGCLLYTSRCV